MPELSDIPHLLHLLDDDSKVVQEEVKKALLSFGRDLEKNLFPHLSNLTTLQQFNLTAFLIQHRRKQYCETWYQWMDYGNRVEGLEHAFSDLAYLDYGYQPISLTALLDQLAKDFRERHERQNVFTLMDFLFNEERLGQPKNDYYNPLNSNLMYTIKSKQGIPITLACIAILVGHRLDIEVKGINFPGNFLCRVMIAGKPHYFDCFQHGKLLKEAELETLKDSLPIDYHSVFERAATNYEIILRVLRNLTVAYEKINDFEGYLFIDAIAKEMQKTMFSSTLKGSK